MEDPQRPPGSSGSRAYQKVCTAFLAARYGAHFREEEEILFAPVQDEQVQKALDEHRQIKALVHTVMIAPAPLAAKPLAELAQLVDAHVRYEERELFPHLESVLTPVQLEKIGRQLHQAPALQDDFEDNFWVKK